MRDAIAISQSLPGPLAIQVGIFISYLRGGFWGAGAGGRSFILPNFVKSRRSAHSMSISAASRG
jgi:chromate transporter